MSIRIRIFWVICSILLAVSACTIPVQKQTTPPLEPSNAPALTNSAAQAESATPEPTLTVAATETAAPVAATDTATLPVGVFPTDTPTPTLEPVFAEVMKETQCRTGPSGAYDLVVTFQTGAKLQVIARDMGGGFIFVQDPDQPDQGCYILSNNVRVSGDVTVFPQYTPQASPTSSPNFKAVFKKFDLCKGDVYAVFTVTNIGSVPFRSAYIKVTNTKNNDSAEWAVEAFDQWTGCTIAKNIAPLNPGQTGYLRSELFKHDPRGNKLRAIIEACTEKGLKGVCPNTIINFQ